MPKLFIIDTFNFLHRAYHALPRTFTDKEGNPTNAVYGVTSMLLNLLTTHSPDYMFAALDGIKPTFRVEDFTGYKAQRKPMEEDLSFQIPKVFEILDAFGIKKIVVEGYEADDIIGTICSSLKNEDIEIIIVSNDRDLWQLLDKNVSVMLPSTSGISEFIGEKEAIASFGFDSKLIPDYKALRGDPSDNIPGVFGIGEKTATELVSTYQSLENIYKNIGEIKESVQKKLIESIDNAYLSKKLATIICDVPMKVSLSDLRYKTFASDSVVNILLKYNFKSLLKRLGLDDRKEVKVSKDQLSLF